MFESFHGSFKAIFEIAIVGSVDAFKRNHPAITILLEVSSQWLQVGCHVSASQLTELNRRLGHVDDSVLNVKVTKAIDSKCLIPIRVSSLVSVQAVARVPKDSKSTAAEIVNQLSP